ncbi:MULTISPECIES: ribosome biogenesis GTP-binding protein YihA/YsxC [unclassified Marinobacter]|mgnify:FL=1|uniref:ribosome biogenesis GTP-binding protein YihA/YsxC n=1 Tax=unclassified Marinobacter TaxID=83889 RepID=UPI000718CCC4|nr:MULTISPECIES: ribosome biogenesis GTP-binding protein YihA/YsxC [unclassified Marinobacter]MDX5440634.1 ribosome biogenesis GTP-binding protein YihA/YsxC [Alteromonadaceae bacterium]AMQ89479.1 YihA family ribosome biogenesis GTP-binding protein [Marinobacter sp. LQ44]MDX5328408.1 ribosome biogenesis GTP-binding protein YihA/YsxC [Marinobacter sp.]MDX5336345.1 ribosome biogenesis GTP-binding protein YihA/YsxC [Marinobacter sp.]MDX5387418.1 ribosome biogenesis GTP-binding protein YihA/YsxC [M
MDPDLTQKSVSFNSARFLISASKLDECPPDIGAEVAFAGRSNAGKSSALNAITANGKLARTSKTPGRTRLINFFTLNKENLRLVDLPGYGYAKVSRDMKDDWQQHLGHYLNDRRCLRGLVLVMDIRHPLTDFDQMMVEWCEHNNLPLMILATKADKLKFGQAKTAMLGIAQKLKPYACVAHLIMFSATSKRGVDECREALTDWLEAPESETP